MKEQAIQKINKMGKAGSIVLRILRIFFYIGLIGMIVGGAILASFPDDALVMKAKGIGEATINTEAFSKFGMPVQLIKENKIPEGGLAVFSWGDTDIVFDHMETDGNYVTLSANGELNESTINVKNFSSVLFAGAFDLVFRIISLIFAGILCKALQQCESPFAEDVIRKMKWFAYSLIPWVILNNLSSSMSQSLLKGHMQVNLSVDFSMLLIVLVVLALAYIFSYGAMLQQESDETL